MPRTQQTAATDEERALVIEYRRKKNREYMREYRRKHKDELEAQAFARDLEKARAEKEAAAAAGEA